ncbi:hypothetical protein BOX15_Mlig029846g3 [Macrostomum lignano]|uniref:Sushi domain-containing protein n=1 Tax=Macrostomum lignano TaxID=282301 RepID=A0A267GFJ7_9PLAT|nr:hypothetical protein BOX15_Mlig029846g2 [Macrostomum lignano]PAA84823.1 hypothetical protein BOX15_Mlig029846g3 [Macrostomum lignano]
MLLLLYHLTAALLWLIDFQSSANAMPPVNGATVCSGSEWTYMPVSGKCYQRLGSVYAPVGRETARQRCATAGGSLARVDGDANVFDLSAYCMAVLFTGASIWADAVVSPKNDSEWIWQATSASVDSKFWSPGGLPASPAGRNCSRLIIDVSVASASGYWAPSSGLRAESCTNNFTVVCEKPASTCSVSQIRGLNPLTMVMSNISYGLHLENVPHHGLLSDIRCRPGFYRNSDRPLAKTPAATPTPEGLLPHQAFCLANGTFAYGSIEPCYPIRCNATILKSDMRIPHVMPYADTLVHEFYNYTHQFSVNCKKGYVSYKNSSVITGEIACDQSFRDPTQGEWSPPDLNTCTAVKCDDISTVISSQAAPYKAENRDDQKSYGEFQQSSFPFYPNLVSVKCRQIGYFFEDRQFEKLLRCGLANGSLIKAQWYGAQGTDLQRLKTLQCTPVSCLSDRIIRRTADAAAIVKNAQYKAKTTVKYGNGTVAIVPAIEVNLPETYPYATEISFTCENGTETGVGEPALFCKADGQWNTSDLPECIKKSEALQLQGNQKHYVPPAKEAGNAGSVGAVVIMIVVVFCVLVVILDLSTLSRDINLLKTNLRRLRHFKRH